MRGTCFPFFGRGPFGRGGLIWLASQVKSADHQLASFASRLAD